MEGEKGMNEIADRLADAARKALAQLKACGDVAYSTEEHLGEALAAYDAEKAEAAKPCTRSGGPFGCDCKWCQEERAEMQKAWNRAMQANREPKWMYC